MRIADLQRLERSAAIASLTLRDQISGWSIILSRLLHPLNITDTIQLYSEFLDPEDIHGNDEVDKLTNHCFRHQTLCQTFLQQAFSQGMVRPSHTIIPVTSNYKTWRVKTLCHGLCLKEAYCAPHRLPSLSQDSARSMLWMWSWIRKYGSSPVCVRLNSERAVDA